MIDDETAGRAGTTIPTTIKKRGSGKYLDMEGLDPEWEN